MDNVNTSDLELDDSREQPGAIYSRVSDDKQVNLRQLDGLNRALSYLPDHFSVKGSFDEKRSARSTSRGFKRPEFDRMMAGVRSKQFTWVMVYSLDRAFRSVPDFYEQVKVFQANGCELRLVKENITLNSRMNHYDKMFVGMLAIFAEFESDLISDRTKEQMAAHKIRNPFIRYGQMPKITGPKLTEFLRMYYAKELGSHRNAGTDAIRRGRVPFKYSIQKMADHFGVSKGTLSDIINDHVQLGTMKLRDADMRRVMPRDISGLMIPESMKGRAAIDESKLESRLGAIYWPDEVVIKVEARYGKSFKTRGNRDTKHAAFEYGKKNFKLWLKENVLFAALEGDLTSKTPDELADIVDYLNEDYDLIMERQEKRLIKEWKTARSISSIDSA